MIGHLNGQNLGMVECACHLSYIRNVNQEDSGVVQADLDKKKNKTMNLSPK
jgi:hypothetical protein